MSTAFLTKSPASASEPLVLSGCPTSAMSFPARTIHLCCTFAGNPTRQRRDKSWRGRRLLGFWYFRCQRNTGFNGTGRFSKALPNRFAVRAAQSSPRPGVDLFLLKNLSDHGVPLSANL